jgi:CheY-like chemotaxis protein
LPQKAERIARIVVIDDQEEMRQVVRKIVESAGQVLRA